jgi:hypothetical protein
MKTKARMALWLWLAIVMCCSCEAARYNCYNLHYIADKGRNRSSYTGWVQGVDFLPYNTRLHTSIGDRRIYFTAADSGTKVELEYNADRMGMSAARYLDLIMSPIPVSYEGLNAVDWECIKTGTVKVGMTKQGVMIAWGYPPRPATLSLSDERWTYWKGRFDRVVVVFDEDSKVVSLVD